MVARVARGREDRAGALERPHPARRRGRVRPLMDLVRERRRRRSATTRTRRGTRGRRATPARAAARAARAPRSPRRRAAVHLDPVVIEHRARVRVVLAKRADQTAADPARALVAPGIARPVDDARDEIGGQRAEPRRRRARIARQRPQPRQPAGEVIGGERGGRGDRERVQRDARSARVSPAATLAAAPRPASQADFPPPGVRVGSLAARRGAARTGASACAPSSRRARRLRHGADRVAARELDAVLRRAGEAHRGVAVGGAGVGRAVVRRRGRSSRRRSHRRMSHSTAGAPFTPSASELGVDVHHVERSEPSSATGSTPLLPGFTGFSLLSGPHVDHHVECASARRAPSAGCRRRTGGSRACRPRGPPGRPRRSARRSSTG